MMLKAMGIEFDPKMFETVALAVKEIRDRLQRIEDKLDRQSPSVCGLCGEQLVHNCKLEDLGGHSISAVTSTKETPQNGTNRS